MLWILVSSRLNFYFLLLFSLPTGSWQVVISVPAQYTALQGQLVVYLTFQNEEKTVEDEEHHFSKPHQNSSFKISRSRPSKPPPSHVTRKQDGGQVEGTVNLENKERKEEEKNSEDVFDLREGEQQSSLPPPPPLQEPYFLSLFATHTKKALKRYKVPADGSQTGFVFPCGVVVHGGQHILRLKKNKTVIAESPKFNVSWPKVVIDVPSRLETYRSPADIKFRFIQSKCLPMSPKFRTWAELLYHGSDYPVKGSGNPVGLATSQPTGKLILKEKRKEKFNENNLESLNNYWDKNKSYFTSSPESYPKTNSVKPATIGSVNRGTPFGKHVDSSSRAKFEEEQDRNRVSSYMNYYNNKNVSTLRPKRMFTLTSLEGSTIPSMSNSNIRPEALKRWPWETRSTGESIAQRVPVEGSLYSQAVHNIRFSCEVVGPAGFYSVRVVADVPASPIIAQSKVFPVEWAEEFTMSVPRISIIPCLAPVHVTYTHPMCVGSQDKIRVYARVRANVTSANPPMYLRYVMEKRASNKTTTFDCSFFTDEPSEFCFVYVNRAMSGAVSDVQRQCVPTFKPNVLRMDGNWSDWTVWSDCSSTCGSGVRVRYRICDNPPPRNGGLFCQGPSVATSSCGDPGCDPGPQYPVSSSVIPPFGESQECQCGCYLSVEKDFKITLSSSAEDCIKHAVWIVEGPPGTIIAAELSRAALLPGFQWLKIRDGNSSSSALLLALPSSQVMLTKHLEDVPARLTSTTPVLFIGFRSDVNASFIGSVWGFRMTVQALSPQSPELVLAVVGPKVRQQMSAIHIVLMTLAAAILLSTAAYAAYYCRSYRRITETLLFVDDSPLETPEGSPVHQRRKSLITSTGSNSTLTEVLSLKSIKFGTKKTSSSVTTSSAYTRVPKGDSFKGILRSLPSSLQLVSKGTVMRSSSQLTKILRRGNNYKKQKNRRSASFDHLSRTPCTPIVENKTLTSSATMEDICRESEGKKVFIEMETKRADSYPDRGEDTSSKYKEHRKSLLATSNRVEKLKKDELEPTKLSKERLNRERVSLERLRRDTDTSVRPASSVSEISVSGTEMELEYDYYDYDVGNASAVPGSLFGMDPTLVPWMIDIDDLDIKSADQLTSPQEDVSLPLTSPLPPTGGRNGWPPEEIPMQRLNILPVTDILQESSTSNESNDVKDVDEDRTPTAGGTLTTVYNRFSRQNDTVNDDETEQTKILNIHDGDDFQFADDSEDEE